MKVIHSIKNVSAKRSVEGNLGFFLSNNNGSYAYLKSEPSSRYQGIFFYDDEERRMFRLIENIELECINQNNNQSSHKLILKNNFYSVERQKADTTEKFIMPKYKHSIVYSLSKKSKIILHLDVKESYDNRQFGRYYDIFLENGAIVIKFVKRTDQREDDSDGQEEYSLYIAVKSDGAYENIHQWVERFYAKDKERNSVPYTRFVYRALRFEGRNFVFSFGKDRKSVLKECSNIYSNIKKIETVEKNLFYKNKFFSNYSFKKILKSRKITNNIKIAYVCALNSINNLILGKTNRVFAGLPWFFQEWSRDTLVSLNAVKSVNKTLSQNIMNRYFDFIIKDDKKANADSIGWFFQRFFYLNGFKAIKDDEKIKNIEKIFEKIIRELKDGFCLNNRGETWMDSIDRNGARIEMQAMILNLYNKLYSTTKNKKYRILENITKNKVREKFWNGSILADGADDFTVRPNIFIAAYIYPWLLSNEEWEKCFGSALDRLWLDWGGISTIDKTHYLFTQKNTGENPKSYHNGDSWFWLNNLCALVLNNMVNQYNNKKSNIKNIDKKIKNKFIKYITKIIEASTDEILWHGAVGCHSEISDANKLESRGCINQLWSSAMFVEMVEDFA